MHRFMSKGGSEREMGEGKGENVGVRNNSIILLHIVVKSNLKLVMLIFLSRFSSTT